MSQIGKQILGLFFMIGLLLSACDQEEAATNTPTSIPLAQQPTATIEPTITASSTPTAASTPHPTATPTLQPTNTPTIEPTPTPTTDPNPFPKVPIISFSAEEYQLRPPDPDQFLDVLEMSLRYNRSFSISSQYDYGPALLREGNAAFSLFMVADQDNYFPDGLPNAAHIFEDKSFASGLYIIYPELQLQKVLRTALIDHIMQYGFLSTEDFNFVQIPINLDEALQPSWLLELTVPRFGLHEWIPFYLDESNKYQIIDNDLQPVINVFNTEAEVTHDLTGDGIPEVVLVQNDYLYAGRYGGYVSVNTWNGDRLIHLDQIDFSAHVNNGSVEQEIGDFNEDGREEIRIIQHHYANFGCSWDEISIYQWQGLEPQHTTTGSERPDSPLCNTARGMSFGSSLSTDERIQLLEEVLQDLSIDTAPSVDFLTLIRVRLAVLYTALGLDEDARRVIDGINDYPNDTGFVQFVNTHLETAGDSLISLCDSMHSAIGIPPSSRLGTDVDDYISVRGYPLDGSPNPDAVCPLSWLISERLKTGQFPLEEELTTSFRNLDLPYISLQKSNLDSDSELENMGLIDLSEKTLLILDAAENTWIPSVIDNFSPSVEEVQLEFRDIDEDGETELLLMVILGNDCGGVNDTGKQTHQVYVIEQIEGDFESIQNRAICDTEVNFSSLDFDDTFDSPPFWAELAGEFPWTGVYFGEDDNFYDYLDTLTAEVINQEKPVEETRNSIETLMNALPPNDPLSDILRPRLLFTLGYHYELNGDESNAVQTYLEIIQFAPRSPWSWLAWIRLENT